MKKGYTLIELLGVIILLSLLTLLIVPNIVNSIKKSNNNRDELSENLIISAAKLYMDDIFLEANVENGFTYCVLLTSLINKGYLEAPVKYGNMEDVSGVKAVKITYNDAFYYSVVDKNTCTFKNTLMVQDQTNDSSAYFFNTDLLKFQINELHIVNNVNFVDVWDYIKIFDVSEAQDGSVRLWYKYDNGYVVYIGSESVVYANANSRRAFSNLEDLTELDLDGLDTSNVIDASYMFANNTSMTDLDLSSFDTSKVNNMSHMFENCTSITEIDMDSFTTESLTNITKMFVNTSSLDEIKMVNANYNSVDTANDVFKNSKDGLTVRTNNTARTRISNYLVDSQVQNPNIITTN